MKKKITALVPMRHSSERVPGKNYRDFDGKPLFYWVVKSLIDSKVFDQIVIDTDSDKIMELSQNFFGNEVVLLERPENLRAGEIPMNDVLLNSINQLNSDFFFQTHGTNPLLNSETVKQAVNTFLENYPLYDSLFSVTKLHTRLWDGLSRPMNHNKNILLRTQDLPPVYEENSCIYIFTKDTLVQKHNRIGDRPFLFEIEELEAIDIDVELDFQVAELLFKAQ
ncbi:acylneuraminate cytidylyltransferase family protein [Croceitalea sp. MTPC9]|uniref:acylneuraminate cytidylyltransferase family protein n=1 Tax=unclassified Croceitalea TaxID=2632280 RepID=UPI002B3E4B65|nr:acylneuraminate cytidylyltransferase family protein [Croceitalea sp. MTPC6]GMN16590.1 acylneuraminate cytidylyltransferase family protein [Croceitalea sp. MTPC9]